MTYPAESGRTGTLTTTRLVAGSMRGGAPFPIGPGPYTHGSRVNAILAGGRGIVATTRLVVSAMPETVLSPQFRNQPFATVVQDLGPRRLWNEKLVVRESEFAELRFEKSAE